MRTVRFSWSAPRDRLPFRPWRDRARMTRLAASSAPRLPDYTQPGRNRSQTSCLSHTGSEPWSRLREPMTASSRAATRQRRLCFLGRLMPVALHGDLFTATFSISVIAVGWLSIPKASSASGGSTTPTLHQPRLGRLRSTGRSPVGKVRRAPRHRDRGVETAQGTPAAMDPGMVRAIGGVRARGTKPVTGPPLQIGFTAAPRPHR